MTQRILFVIDSFHDLCEGYFFREVLSSLLRNDLEIRIVVTQSRHPGNELLRAATEHLPMEIDLVPRRFHWDPACAAGIRGVAHRFAADVLHSWGDSTLAIAGLASCGARWKHIANKFNLYPVSLADRLAFRRTAVILVNHASVRGVLDQDGCGDRVQVLHMGAPLAKFDNVQGTLDSLRDRYEIPEDLFLIGARADFLPVNRLKDLLWATDLLQTIRSDFRFLLFGNGPQRWRLKRFARQSHADRKTIFLPATENLLPWFRELDLYWHSFEYDPCPFEIAAATRGGCPTLAPRLLGESGVIHDSLNGLMFDVGQRDQIARITNALLNEPDKLELLKQSTFSLAEERDIQTTAEQLVQAYRTCGNPS